MTTNSEQFKRLSVEQKAAAVRAIDAGAAPDVLKWQFLHSQAFDYSKAYTNADIFGDEIDEIEADYNAKH